MKYELAKELKDARFPQNHWPTYYKLGGKYEDANCSVVDKKNDVADPALSELVEACGEDFNDLQRLNDTESSALNWSQNGGWEAGSREDRSEYVFQYGKTPEEAVAKLWLALNK